MRDTPALSVVIPAYNEAERIGPTLEAVGVYLKSKATDYEIIVISDGSTDSTVEVVNSYACHDTRIRLIHYSPNKGKGQAVRAGVLEARAQNVLITDADLATPIEDFENLRQAASNGCEIVIGSRALKDSSVEGWRPWYRVLSGKIFNKMVQFFTVPGIHDTQCGFKLFTSHSAHRIFSFARINGFAFDVESLFLARKFGYRISEVPVRWSNSPATKVSVFRHTVPMLCELIRIRLFDWKKKYEQPPKD